MKLRLVDRVVLWSSLNMRNVMNAEYADEKRPHANFSGRAKYEYRLISEKILSI